MRALHVLFEVGGVEYALAAEDVLQIQPFEDVTPVPGSARHVAGLMQARGRVVPVVDLRRRFGVEAEDEPRTEPRVIVTHSGGRTVGLLADRAREVVHIEAETSAPPPELVADESAGYVRAVVRVGERLLMLIDLPRVIGEERLHAEQR